MKERLQAKLDEYTEVEHQEVYFEEDKEPINYIEQFMQDNDLQIWEEFWIEGHETKYHFEEDFILYSDTLLECDTKLFNLISGKLKPIKLEPQVDWDSMEGEWIEVSYDEINWSKRKLIIKYGGTYYCKDESEDRLARWTYARLIKE